MSRAPDEGAPKDAGKAAIAEGATPTPDPAAAALAHAVRTGVQLPISAVQKSRFPYLQHFAARGRVVGSGKLQRIAEYEVRHGFVLGFKAGREFTLSFTPGMPARAMAELYRQAAATLDQWADACDRQGVDPRDEPANDSTPAGGHEPPPPAVAVPCPGGHWVAPAVALAGDVPALCSICGKQADAHLSTDGNAQA